MIKITSKNSGNPVIVAAEGIVTQSDYENVLIPAIKAALKAHKRIRLLFQLDKGLSELAAEAIWTDAKLGLSQRTAFDAIAVVTDEKWVIVAAKSFRYLLGYPVRAFRKARAAEAMDWVGINNSAPPPERPTRFVFGWYRDRETRTIDSSSPIRCIPPPKRSLLAINPILITSAQPSESRFPHLS